MRNATLDIIKGIGILLVAVGHNAVISGVQHPEVHRWIYLFHMPLFFMVSGALTQKFLPWQKLSSRVRALIWPYLFSFIIFLPRQLSFDEHPTNVNPVGGLLWGAGNTLYNTPVWFLLALAAGFFSLNVIRLFLSKFQGKVSVWYEATLAIALIASNFAWLNGLFGEPFGYEDSHGRPIGLPLNVDILPCVVGFLILGRLINPAIEYMQAHADRAFWLTIFCFTAAAVCISQTNVDLDLNYRRAVNPPVALLVVLLMTAAVTGLSVLINLHVKSLRRPLVFLGQHTLLVLIFHAPIQSVILRRIPEQLLLAALVSLCVCFALAIVNVRIIESTPWAKKVIYGK